MTRVEGGGESGFIDDAAARSLDENGAVLHQPEFARANKAMRGREQRNVQGDNVGGLQQLVERDGFRATSCSGFWIARSGVEINNVAAILSERFSNSQAYDAETHNTSKEAVEAGKIIRDHASAKLVIPSGADFCVGPGETAQKNRSCGNHILGDGLVAAARNISHGNAKLLQERQVQAIETGAGDLNEFYRSVLKQP